MKRTRIFLLFTLLIVLAGALPAFSQAVTVSSPTVAEGDAGKTTVSFQISTSGFTAGPLEIAWTTADVTTVAGTDYDATTGSKTITENTSTTITVEVTGDVTTENDETFTLNVTAGQPVGGPYVESANSFGTGTITNDDAVPTITIGPASATEGSNVVFPVALSNPTALGDVDITYSTADGTADDLTDYTGHIATPAVGFIPAGSTSGTISVVTSADTSYEANETFTLQIDSATNVSGAPVSATGTITNDDTAPTVSIDDPSTAENVTPLTFTVTLSAAAGVAVSGSYHTQDGTAGGSDYTTASGTWSIPAGSSSTTIDVTVLDDLAHESSETLTLLLTDLGNATFTDAQGTGTITDDDVMPTFSVDDPGSAGEASSLTFTVTLSAASGQTTTVDYATVNGSAVGGNDFVSRNGTLTFLPGETSKTVNVPHINDTVDEPNQTYTLQLSNPVNAGISDGSGAGTITDNDPFPTVDVNSVTVAEASGEIVFEIKLSAPSERLAANVSVDYCTTDVTADSTDYTGVGCGTPGTVNFAPGTTTQWVTLPILADGTSEPAETFTITLSNPTNLTLGDSSGTGTIVDDDSGMPTVSIGDAAVVEGNSPATPNMVFTVTLSETQGADVDITFATANGTATLADIDYVNTSGTATITAGTASTTISVPVNGDSLYELDETFFVNLTGVSSANAVVADGSGTGTIQNDDAMPTLSINDASSAEGGNVQFTITLGAATGAPVTVSYATVNNTAVEPADYTAVSSSHTFSPSAGPQTFNFNVTTLDDAVYEGSQTFRAVLSSAVNGLIGDGEGQGTITDNDSQPTLAITGAATVAENGGSVLYTVTATGSTEVPITFDFTTEDVTAISGQDYGYRGGSRTITAPATTATISVPIIDDGVSESTEDYNVTISNAVNASILTPTANTDITDNDIGGGGTPTVSIDSANLVEANGTMVFRVVLSEVSTIPVTVEYTTSAIAGSATPGTDYVHTGVVGLTFAPGETVKNATVSIVGDANPEPDEMFNVMLQNPTNATLLAGASTGLGVIIDDDVLPVISINDVSVNENTAGTVFATFTVALSEVSADTITVNFGTSDGTATGGLPGVADYDTSSGTVTFDPGETSQTITITVNGDALDEVTETFYVNLTSLADPTTATLPPLTRGTGTIVDDDATPALSIAADSASVAEGVGNATYTVTLTPVSGRTVTVHYNTVDGSAINGADYTATSGTLTFVAGDTSETITVPITNDTIDEAAENFTVLLHSADGATISAPTATQTVTDNDPLPSITIDNVSVIEDTDSIAVFDVILNRASGRTVTLNYSTGDGTATLAGTDYTQIVGGTVQFFAGETVKTITVDINPDAAIEGNEHFFLNLDSATNAGITIPRGVATIVDDDGQPTLSIADPAAEVEGNVIDFTISLAPASDQTVTVQWSTSDGTATVGEGDYNANSGTVTFAPGDTSETVSVTTIDDATYEPSETFHVTLSSPTNALIGDVQATGTIDDNDGGPQIDIDNTTVFEGNAGTTNVIFNVTLSAPSEVPITVQYDTADGSGVDAATTADLDYQAVVAGTVTFAPGETVKSVNILVNGDTDVEANEHFFVTLSNQTAGTIGAATATGFVLNDDGAPVISINDVAFDPEGNAGSGTLTFNVTLNVASDQVITVNYATQDDSATSGLDYTAEAGTVTFAAGDTSEDVTIDILGDVFLEADETFFVNLSNAVNASIADAQGIGTIVDDDTLPAISIGNRTRLEGDSGKRTYDFSVTLSAPSEDVVTVDYATANDTATSGSGDYDPTNGTIVFAPGQTTATITVLGNGDTTYEQNETFFVDLSNPVNATFTGGDAQGLGTINNDDALPVVTISSPTVVEGNSGTATMVFTLTLSNPRQGATSVEVYTVDGTALDADNDYDPVLATVVNFPGGTTVQTVPVTINGDTVNEADEQFYMYMQNVTGLAAIVAGPGTEYGTGTIQNDDGVPTVSVLDAEADEGGNVVFTVSLSNPISDDVVLSYTLADGSAVAPGDYDATGSGSTLTITAGTTGTTITVPTSDEGSYENDETFSVTLGPITSLDGGVPNAALGDSGATGTIHNVTPVPVISVDSPSANEDAVGELIFTATLTGPTEVPIDVTYTSVNGTAQAGSDFTATTGTLNFPISATASQDLTFVVPFIADGNVEPNEVFTVVLTNTVNSTVAQGTGTIINDDGTPALSIADNTIVEGDSGTSDLVFTVTLSPPSDSVVTVEYNTSPTGANPATSGDDYEPQTGMLTFAAGDTQAFITVPIVGDDIYEPTETFNVTLSNPQNAIFGDATALGTITDNEALPEVSIGDVTLIEPNSGSTSASFIVSLNRPSSTDITFDIQTTAVDATPGTCGTENSDYEETTLTAVVIPAGATAVSISVPVCGDNTDENNETFEAEITAVSVNATIGDDIGVATIMDDDGTPTLAVTDTTVLEGSNAFFTVELSNPIDTTVTATYALADGSAFAATDYDNSGSGGTITFAPGTTIQTVAVPTTADNVYENDETFTLTLTAVTSTDPGTGSFNAVLGDDEATGTIVNTTPIPVPTIGDVSQNEDAGPQTFTVTLDRPTAVDLPVSYLTSNGTAQAGEDYTAVSGTLTFTGDELILAPSMTLDVPITADPNYESDETFTVVVNNPLNASTDQATGTILDDDLIPTVSIAAGGPTAEGDTGDTNYAVFTVSLSHASNQAITFQYRTVPGSGTATSDIDYASQAESVTFLPGVTSTTVEIPIIGDDIYEGGPGTYETFDVDIFQPEGAVLGTDTATFSIEDDDAMPDVSISNPSVVEPDVNPNAVEAVFTVTLSNPSASTVTVDATVADGSATAGVDYTAPVTNPVTLTFLPGQVSQTFSVAIIGDVLPEANETFTATLSSASAVTIASPVGTATILDNDRVLSLSGSDITVAESVGNAMVTVNVSPVLPYPVEFDVFTTDDSAKIAADYNGPAVTHYTIPPSTASIQIPVPIINDIYDEPAETFFLNISNPIGAVVGDAQAIITIDVDAADVLPAVSINDVQIREGDAGGKIMSFTISLSAVTEETVYVQYDTSDGNSDNPGCDPQHIAMTTGLDYFPSSDVARIDPGDLTDVVSVIILGDTLVENYEQFTITLSDVSPNAMIIPQDGSTADGVGIGTILDDEIQMVLTATPNPQYTYLTVDLSAVLTTGMDTGTGCDPDIESGIVGPTGIVSFYDGVTHLGDAAIVAGVATLSGESFPTPGIHNLTATYAGDVNWASGNAATDLEMLLLGDLDKDLSVGVSDLVILANALAGNLTPGVAPWTAPVDSADLNLDGPEDVGDLVILANYLAGNIGSLPY